MRECENSIDLNNTWCIANQENYNALVRLGIEFVGNYDKFDKYFVIQDCFSSYDEIKDKTWFKEINKQVHIVNGKFEFVKEKSELDILKEKYKTGEYILVRNKLSNKEKFFIDDKFYYQIGIKIVLVSKKHKQILDAYIENNEVEIELNSKDDIWLVTDFINKYNEDFDYRLKPKQEFPIFKENEDGEILKFTSENFYEIVLSYAYTYIGKKYRNVNKELLELLKDVPYNKKRNLYHKQPIWCWDNHCKCSRQLRLYDAINNSTFDTFGNENGASYNNYEPLTTDQIKSMSFIWNMYKKI